MKYFKNTKQPRADELVHWFSLEFKEMSKEMKVSNHNFSENEVNPFHVEDSVWSHSMMVLLNAKNEKQPKINLICALLHDVGKPHSREEVPSETDDTKPNKVRFFGHEGLSFHKAIAPLNDLEKIGVINLYEKNLILKIISMHGDLFEVIDSEGKERKKKTSKIVNSFDSLDEFVMFINQVKNDFKGRFHLDEDKEDVAESLGNTVFNRETFEKYKVYSDIDESKPSLVYFVGVPNVGKSTLRNKDYLNYTVISLNDELQRYVKEELEMNVSYTEAFKILKNDKHSKNTSNNINKKFNEAVRANEDILIDMTNMSAKSRRKFRFSTNLVERNYRTKAVLFCVEEQEIYKRNILRNEAIGKFIPEFVIKNMMSSFSYPSKSEGFDEIEVIWN